MLAIAGVVTWFGYLVMTYGLSQLTGQNYSFLDLAIPGKFTLGSPAPDPKGTGSTTTPVTGGAQKGSGLQGPVPTGGGYATQAACEKATGMSCDQVKGRWYGFTGKIKGT
jgi:hypothetical protein